MLRQRLSYGVINMNNTSFGESALSLFTLVYGKTLSYCYSNRETPSLLR